MNKRHVKFIVFVGSIDLNNVTVRLSYIERLGVCEEHYLRPVVVILNNPLIELRVLITAPINRVVLKEIRHYLNTRLASKLSSSQLS